MRILILLAWCATVVHAGPEVGRTLRSLKADDRQRRRAALAALADGTVAPASRSETQKTERALARFLSDRRPGVERALAVRALGRIDRPGLHGRLLARLAPKEADDRVLHAAEEVFRLAPVQLVPEFLRRINEEKDPARRAVLLRLLGALPDAEARRRVRLRATMADHWCPRAAALHALARDRDEAAFEPLIAALDEDDPALVTAAVESLTRLTRRGYGREVAQWKTWWATRGKVKPLEEAIAESDPDGRRTYAHETTRRTIAPTYFGIPIGGRRIVFVFDVSASMRYKLPLAYDQLARATKGLPSDAMFEVVFFNEHVWPWRDRLSHADPVTKLRLLEHLPTIEIKSYTNLYDSIETALEMRPDEVFVISDGEPNRGRWRLPRDVIREVKEANVRKIKIHTVSVVRVVDGDSHIALLRTIAEDSGAQHVQRTLK